MPIFKKKFILELEKGRGRKKEGNIDVKEKYQSIASCMHPALGSNLKPDMCLDQESNLQPFDAQNNVSSNLAAPDRALC